MNLIKSLTFGNKMTSLKKTVLLLVLIISSVSLNANDEILRAMRDEIKRSMDELKLEDLQKPYYIEYTVTKSSSFVLKSQLGSITEETDDIRTTLDVQVRVGDYKFDNTNFFDVGLSFFGSTDDEERFTRRQVAGEPDYKSLRRDLWLATDAAYKRSAELLAKKEAALKNRMRTDTTHDLLKVNPEKNYYLQEIPVFEKQKHISILNKLSAVFAEYPGIISSSVGMEYLPKEIYYVNSEGMEYTKTELFTGLEIVAYTQANDGMPLVNYFTAYGKTPADLPISDSLVSAAKHTALKLNELKSAPVLELPYAGPVLFIDNAAGEVFAQAFAPNLVAQRFPLTEQGIQENDRFAAFQNKVGGRVLPEFFNVEAIPLEKSFADSPLAGSFSLDDDGIKASKVSLVIGGYLKALLNDRVPTRRVRESNGHKRAGSAMLSNIRLQAGKEYSVSYDSLKSKMIKLCKDRELEYGIVVKRILNQNIMMTTLYSLTYGEFQYPRGNGKLAVVEAYKIYPDGKEELIRGCEGAAFNVQTFKDIILAGNEYYVYNYLAPAVISSFISGGSPYLGTSVIVPDLLFEDAEISTINEDFKRPPIIESPLSN